MRIDTATLASLLRRAAEAHHKFEEATGKPDTNWPEWYAEWISEELALHSRG